MYKLISLNKDNYNLVLNLYKMNSKISNFTKFINFKNEINFFSKIINHRHVFLIELNKLISGYIVFEKEDDNLIEIIDIFFKSYEKSFVLKEFNMFKSKNFKYSCLLTDNNRGFIKDNSFIITNRNLLMKKLLFKNEFSTNNTQIDLSIRNYHKKQDEFLRCFIQNDVFKKEGRVPLSVNDILAEYEELYYINDLNFFLYLQNNPIGYGQVIKFYGNYMIVNLGILSHSRKKGYGEFLLDKIINISKRKGITEIYIKVDYENIIAQSLYYKKNFKPIGEFINCFIID